MTSTSALWIRLGHALTLLAIDPEGLGGMWLKARAGPVRDFVITNLVTPGLALQKLHPNTTDEQLFGGVDVTGTLATGRLQRQEGLFSTPATFLVPMAERMDARFAARLALALDGPVANCLVALDEGCNADEGLPTVLADRVAFHFDLSDILPSSVAPIVLCPSNISAARDHLSKVNQKDADISALTCAADALGISDLRAPTFALRVARANASLNRRIWLNSDDLEIAAELVYGSRTTHVQEPQSPLESQPNDLPPPPTNNTPSEGACDLDDISTIPMEMLVEAAIATLPPDILLKLRAGGPHPRLSSGSAGSGHTKKSNRRGRPMPSMKGKLDGVSIIDLISTLRAAAPWQTIRRRSRAIPRVLHVDVDDIRTKRFEEKSDRLLIFVVDASGSSAVARLAEAKGAVELLLGEAYARRDHVALVSFRGNSADLLLPPTRSLVQTKRRLSALPGGGGTPLAAGLKTALDLSVNCRNKGMTPTVALLTDGRANIALDGTANRAIAADDALCVAQSLRGHETPALVIDTGTRPQMPLQDLAKTLNAPYIPLPRADARRLSNAVSSAINT